MDDDIVRIVVSTDNHLGFMQKDPVRGNDSFSSFEEVLSTARQMHADFVLLAGDLFHENKPSRKTTHMALDLMRKYCTGVDPVFMEIINDQTEIFKNCGHQTVNYEDPFQSISLPVMAIHGNHDDPSREGVGNALAALDLLSVTNLVNYIGKYEQVDDIMITPILIRKGETKIALYALGAVRDERLNRMWSQKNVKFLRPTEAQGRAEFLNIFVLHQNRDYGRGKKNCIHESMIPDWMDVVIWGNEHECIPSLVESLVGKIFCPVLYLTHEISLLS
jgi:double-strand break repair protein MRE11